MGGVQGGGRGVGVGGGPGVEVAVTFGKSTRFRILDWYRVVR